MADELTVQQQQQINQLNASVGALQILVENSLEKFGDNQRMIKALHQRFDNLDERMDKMESELKDIDFKVLTKEERKSELEEIIQAKVGSWVLKALGGLIALKVTALIAWFNGAFSGGA